MEVDRYKEILADLEMLIEVGTAVSKRLDGTTPQHKHLSYADPIYTKLLCHAISLHKLSPQLISGPAKQLWDMPSACAIARCIIEAHDVLEYIVFAELSEQERDFRLLVWKLHDQQRRSKMLHLIDSKEPKAAEIHARAQALANEAMAHPWFKNISHHQQSRIRTDDAPSFLLSQRDLNASNGVNHEYYTAATMMLSQYVHTLPMSVHQLFEFKAGKPEALHMSSIPIQYSLGFLSRTILRMVKTFPVATQELTSSQEDAFSRWSAVVKFGVSTITLSE